MIDMLLTIAIPTYNGYRTLKDTVQSSIVEIERCRRTDVNIEIFDNGSTGLSKDILDSMVLPAGSIIHNSKENRGYDVNVKRAFELSQGRFIKILADDDVLAPGSLLRHLEAIEKHPNSAFIVSDFVKCSAEMNTEIEMPILPAAVEGLHSGELGLGLAGGRFGQVSSLTFNKSRLREIDLAMGLGTDYVHVFATYSLASSNDFYILTGGNILVRDGSPNFSASNENKISTPVKGLGAIQNLRKMGYSNQFVSSVYRDQARYISGLMVFGKIHTVAGLQKYLRRSFAVLGPRAYLFATALALAIPGAIFRSAYALAKRINSIGK